jgi:hypothetical protein
MMRAGEVLVALAGPLDTPTAGAASMSELIVLHGCATIQLTRGKNSLVDARDYAEMSGYRWHTQQATVRDHYYAVRSKRRDRVRTIHRLHREIAMRTHGDFPRAVQVDHKNRDSLDNRRENLRLSDPSTNRANAKKTSCRETSSQFKGVFRLKGGGLWLAVIQKDKRKHRLGYYESEADAARAYNRTAVEMFGEFARINEGV